MIRYYTYYNYGGYKTLLLGSEEEIAESTYYLPLLPIEEKKLEENPDEKLAEKVERQKKLVSIPVVTNQSENNLSTEASVALSHGGYKLIYQTTTDGRRFISLRDIEAEKDDTGRDAPFLMIWEGDSEEDWQKMDMLAEFIRENLTEVEANLPKLFEYDPINNGLRFHIGAFNEYMSEIWTSKDDSEAEPEASLTETSECDSDEEPEASLTETSECDSDEEPEVTLTETSECDSEAEPEATLTETSECDSEAEPEATLTETSPLYKVRLLILTPGTSIDVPVKELKIDRSDISIAEDTSGKTLIDISDKAKEQDSTTSPFQRYPTRHNGDRLTNLLDRIDDKALRQDVDRLKELGVNKVKETLPKFKKFLVDILSDMNK